MGRFLKLTLWAVGIAFALATCIIAVENTAKVDSAESIAKVESASEQQIVDSEELERLAKLEAERKAEAERRARSWTHRQSKDEMSGDISYYASSKRTGPQKLMEFPYRDTESSMNVGCSKGSSPWVYFWFSNSPNLTGDTTRDGYNEIRTRIRWDDDPVESVVLIQNWGEKFIHVDGEVAEFVRFIGEKESVLLELNWHGSGRVHFLYDLTGSKEAMGKIKDCNWPK